MPIPLILQKQKADIVRVLDEAGHSASEFSWTDDASKHQHGCVASTITYKPGEYYFRIDRNTSSNWVVEFCPSDKKWICRPDSTGDWYRVVEAARDWSSYVTDELDAINYLAVAMNSPGLLRLPMPDEDNSEFSDFEQLQLVQQLERIEKQLLYFHEEDDVYRGEVRKNFQVLRQEVARGGRTAFRYALFGALLAIGLEFLDSDQTKQIIDFATRQINCVSESLTQSPSD